MRARSLWRRVVLSLALILPGLVERADLIAEDDVAAIEAPPGGAAAGDTVAVSVPPEAGDAAIAGRLQGIFAATGWFESLDVSVGDGVVFLRGRARDDETRQWAVRIARDTEGVAAVVNNLDVVERSMWDLSETWASVRSLTRLAVRQSPLVLLGLVMLLLSWILAVLASRGMRTALRSRWSNVLLRNMVANTMAVLVFVLGVYFVLKVSGLTRLAVTVLGGTGLMGLVIGFAFRDIAENFLASLLMSIQRPFETGDLIEVAGVKGYVQQVNSRSTLLMTLQGHQVQIPNATVYKEKITNFWANPQMRCEFFVGIGYDDVISHAQSLGVQVLREHPAVLADPEPSVLVDSLGASTVNLRFWFWINVRAHSDFKVKSAVIRQTKRAFQQAGISMPDEARELIFPRGVPVELVQRAGEPPRPDPEPRAAQPPQKEEETALSDAAEGGTGSDAGVIERQARHARLPEGGRNLLDTNAAADDNADGGERQA